MMTRSVQWLGDPVSEVVKYKKILLAWAVSTGNVGVVNPPYSIADVVPTWNCRRDGVLLLAFGKWQNGMGKLPVLGDGIGSEGYTPMTGPCAGIYVADLQVKNYKEGLEAWATGATGAWTACPSDEVYDPIKKQCVKLPQPSSTMPAVPGQPVLPVLCPVGQKWDAVAQKCVPETPTPRKPPSRLPSAPSTDSSSGANTGLLVAGGLALVGFVGWLVLKGKGTASLQDNPSGGINLSDANLFGRDQYSEEALRKAFKWLERTGAGRHMPMPIGWYQSHQIAALETIQKAAGVRGLAPDPRDESWYFRLRGGEYQVWEYEKKRWIGLGLTPRQVFETADRKGRGLSPNPAPKRNIYWRDLGWGDRVELHGKPRSQYYVAVSPSKQRAVINWEGREATDAQRFLDMKAAQDARRPAPVPVRLYLERVRLDSGGYDSRGRYYGLGQPLYRASNDNGDIDIEIRATDRNHAKDLVRRRLLNYDVRFTS